MKTVHIPASRQYDVLIGRGLLQSAGAQIRGVTKASAIMIVSDDAVWPLFGETVQRSLEAEGFRVCTFVFPHGESSKNAATYLQLLDALAAQRLTRTDALVALGGGVVGDLTGFAASTYLRGLGFIQIPTTLLAMVDSSVGGKTAIDLPAGKNLAGTFYQPWLVLCDPDCLQTLPENIFRDGCAEVIKYAVLGSAPFFDDLSSVPARDQLEHIIETCVRMAASEPWPHVRSRDRGLQRLFRQSRLRRRHRHGHDGARRGLVWPLQRGNAGRNCIASPAVRSADRLCVSGRCAAAHGRT